MAHPSLNGAASEENASSFASSAPVASLLLAPGQGQLVENKILKCGDSKKNLDPSIVDQSIYQNEIIGYQDGIFEGASTEPMTIPANLVEVWCRDCKDDQGIETLTFYDQAKQKAVNRVYYLKLKANGTYDSQQISDFPVSRVVAELQVTVSNGNGFQLIVNRDQPSTNFGFFMEHLEVVIDGEKISRESECRLGGTLDPNL